MEWGDRAPCAARRRWVAGREPRHRAAGSCCRQGTLWDRLWAPPGTAPRLPLAGLSQPDHPALPASASLPPPPLLSSPSLALLALALVSLELSPATLAIRFPPAILSRKVTVLQYLVLRSVSPEAGSQCTGLLEACQGPAWSCRTWHAQDQECKPDATCPEVWKHSE